MKRRNNRLKHKRSTRSGRLSLYAQSLKVLPLKLVKALPVLVAGFAVVYGVMFVKNTEFPTVLPFKSIEVTGELKFLEKRNIKMLVKENITGGYLSADLHNIRKILMQDPWIKNVSLRRRWPESIVVTVDEQKPVAYWNTDGYINKSGEVFSPEKIDRRLNLPVLNGPEGRHDNVWKFMNVLYQEMALLDFEVLRLDLDDRRAWRLVISASNVVAGGSESLSAKDSDHNKIDVKLGRFETEKRLQRFVRILPALAVAHHTIGDVIETIDMRYPNGFAVKMKNNSSAQIQHSLQNLTKTRNFVRAGRRTERTISVQMSEA